MKIITLTALLALATAAVLPNRLEEIEANDGTTTLVDFDRTASAFADKNKREDW